MTVTLCCSAQVDISARTVARLAVRCANCGQFLAQLGVLPLHGGQLILEGLRLNASFVRGRTEASGARLEHRDNLFDHRLVVFKLRVEAGAQGVDPLATIFELFLGLVNDLLERYLSLLAGDLLLQDRPEPDVDIGDGDLDRGADHGLNFGCARRRHSCSCWDIACVCVCRLTGYA